MKQTTFSDDDYTPEESAAVFERAAQLQSEDAFAPDNENLDRATLDKSAGRAGIDEKYVKRAVEELRAKERDAAEQKRLLAQAQAQRAALLRKIAVPAGVVVALFGILSYSALNNKLAAVEKQQAQVENVLQRRHNLIPNLISSSKFAASHEREVFASLSQLDQQAKNTTDFAERAQVENKLSGAMREALDTLRDEPGGSKIFLRLSDEMAGAENRISTERKRYNEAVAEYNRTARAFPLLLIRPLLGFPAQKPPFQAESGAREAPKF